VWEKCYIASAWAIDFDAIGGVFMTLKEVYGLSEGRRYQEYERKITVERLSLEERRTVLRNIDLHDAATENDREQAVDMILAEVWQIYVNPREVEHQGSSYEGIPVDEWLDKYFYLRQEITNWYEEKQGLWDVDEDEGEGDRKVYEE
jgi:hypothetical protein